MYKAYRVLKKSTAVQSIHTLIILGISSFIIIWTLYSIQNEPSHHPVHRKIRNYNSLQTFDVPYSHPSSNDQEAEEEKQACSFPKAEAFSTLAYSAFLKSIFGYENCSENNMHLFESSIDSQNLIRLNHSETGSKNLSQCGYRFFTRMNKNDFNITFSDEVFNISQEVTRIPPIHEFIAIQCIKKKKGQLYYDMHAFVPLLGVSKAEAYPTDLYIQQKRPNVVILLIDSVSRLSLIRTMPKTYAYLTKELGAVELKGMVKVGDNTIPNILPLLTGKSWSETESEYGCVPISSVSFDNCSFIWKDFKNLGYVTSFAEDADSINTFHFNNRNGFAEEPTDSYLRPFIRASVLANLTTSECFGSQNRLEFLLDYMRKVAIASNLKKNRPYFQFVISAATHETNVHAVSQDDFLQAFLEWFQSEAYMKNSIFLLMSDHGSRWGSVNSLPQGYIESRMPFAFFMFPKWFRNKFPLAMKNILKNENRLTTVFDIYETLKDVLALSEAIADSSVKQRSDDLVSKSKLPRGISLFLPVPLKRTCSMAGISGLFCVCNLDESIKLDLKSESVLSAAKDTVRFINARISGYKKFCHEVKIDNVTSARLRKDEGDSFETIDLTLVTLPGNATFEVTLVRNVMKLRYGNAIRKVVRQGSWKIVDELTRIDAYRETGFCANNKILKMYCICKESFSKKPDPVSSTTKSIKTINRTSKSHKH